ncbi:CoA transferase [Litorilinea aerophila]|uniref:CoA transferase n=1 Tax=Litorilinea aerophila TaxID=1204385 RepID=A0A540V8J7_9CHLR|nr:CoA transferase [Litorilinea aerophila]MCC9078980.1 CoA transferase [Litorilinea aerophila]
MTTSARALSNILVLDLSRVLAGPYATMLLGDLGARVIKVEHPSRGDDTRHWGPPFTENGESAYFFCANRNKEGITLNLKHPRGQAILRQLAQRADVLVGNFRVGTMERLGLGYQELRRENPGLIYCAITGYGQTGPYRDRPGYDTVIEAQGGIMSITGPPGEEGEPYKVGVAIVDVTSGLHAAIAILAALHHRSRTGEGQFIDIALMDTQVSWLINVASAYLVSGQAPQRYGNAHPSIVPYQTVPTADGWLMLAVGNDRQFARLCAVLGHQEWASDARFATNPARVAHRDELIPLLEQCFRTRRAAEWTELLLAADIPCSPVNDIPTALADPQVQAREMVQVVEHPVTGSIPLLGPVPKMSVTPATISGPPPLLGEHTDPVLSELLGYGPDELSLLRQQGVI